ncbi:MAG: alpha/beta hydrolase [Nevskia sp.]|nr:alpha/beta hydrolase [Nevskia sp.]
MMIKVRGADAYAYTGGRPFDPARPTVVFVHGVLNDHSVWILQTRYLAHHGWNVLAVDQPGHGRSGGVPPSSVEDGADWVLELLAAAGVGRAALVGHSLGSLIALEAASRAQARGAPAISHLALVGTAYPMRVSEALLKTSLEQPLKAIDMVDTFSHSTLAPPPSALGPGTWLYGSSRALLRRVLAGNRKVNLLHQGFSICDRYANGEAAMKSLACPVLFVLGAADQMTAPKAAQSLVAAAARPQVTTLAAGHDLMLEAPDGVLLALRNFLAAA